MTKLERRFRDLCDYLRSFVEIHEITPLPDACTVIAMHERQIITGVFYRYVTPEDRTGTKAMVVGQPLGSPHRRLMDQETYLIDPEVVFQMKALWHPATS